MARNKSFSTGVALSLALGIGIYGIAVNQLSHRPGVKIQDALRVSVPAEVQIALAGGDRYLAANIAVFRAIVVGTDKLDETTSHVLGRVQREAALLNPYHEDNYYLAAAILPWTGEVDAAQYVLERAAEARKKDPLPSFFHGFNQQYFYMDYAGAGRDLEEAAMRSTGSDRSALLAIAAKWHEKSNDVDIAIGTISAMRQSTRDKDLQRYLDARISRLQGLKALRTATAEFQKQTGRPPARLDDLVTHKLLTSLPVDPFGFGYVLDDKGQPVLLNKKPSTN
ncbi:hypothetical protein [Parachitinimonas caeni]|uniref:Uncharacterized protein n=1 Tax=Parachitinimonas caeni TaxID=3031301 RepID=A0ABT7DTC6_9NEIS|nr:hypothetical protein [Parachitinimonas caeni]MDK2123224.1 hypothetical protein [Parachitinimonas caeni]